MIRRIINRLTRACLRYFRCGWVAYVWSDSARYGVIAIPYMSFSAADRLATSFTGHAPQRPPIIGPQGPQRCADSLPWAAPNSVWIGPQLES